MSNLNNIIDFRVVNINMFGVKGSGDGVDESVKFQKAVDYAADNNLPLYIPYGQYYISNIKKTGKSLKVISDGATLIKNANAPMFDLKGGWDFTRSVSAIVDTTWDYSMGDNRPTIVSRLTLSSVTNLNNGDIVKIVSDDEIPSAKVDNPNGKRRCGEFAVVGNVSGSFVYLTSKLRESYATNIRLAKISDVQFEFNGLKFDTSSAGDSLKWNQEYFAVAASKYPRFKNLYCYKGYGEFIKLVGCYGYAVDNIEVNNLKNDPANSIYGYGVNDFSSESGSVANSKFSNVRHGFTTNTSAISANASTIEYYGRTANNVISNCIAYGCSNSGFDCHDEGYNVMFENCITVGTYYGGTSTGAGFGLRGRKTVFNNCTAINCRAGFYAGEAYAGSSVDYTINDCRVIGATDLAIDFKAIGTGVSIKDIKISGGYFEGVGEYVVSFRDCENVTIKNTIFVSKNSVAGMTTKIFYVEDSSVRVSNIEARFESSDLTDTPKLIKFSDINLVSSFIGRDIELIHNNHAIQRFAESSTVSSAYMELDRVTMRIPPTFTPFNVSNYKLGYRCTASGGASNYVTASAGSSYTPSVISNITDDVIYLKLNVTGTSVMGKIPNGYKVGQMLIIENATTTSKTIDIPNNATTNNTRIRSGTSKTLNVNDIARFIWIGDVWVDI